MIDFNKLIQDAILSKNNTRLNTYRNIKAELQKYETSKDFKEWTDSKQLEIINKVAKSLEESIKMFEDNNRLDLVYAYTNELNIVKELLPKPVTENDIRKYMEMGEGIFDPYLVIVEHYYDNTDYTNMELRIPKKDMGFVIKNLKSIFPTTDGKLIADIVKSYIY